jgi:hypothetical protein
MKPLGSGTGGVSGPESGHGDGDRDAVTRHPGVGADPVGLVHQLLGGGGINARQVRGQIGDDPETARILSDRIIDGTMSTDPSHNPQNRSNTPGSSKPKATPSG